MASEQSVGAVWREETDNGVVLHMRVGTGADMVLTLPNAEVAAQAEAQLRSTLAMATMRFQRIVKETTSSGKSWEGFMPQETKAHVAAQAEHLVKAISEGRLAALCWRRSRASCTTLQWPRLHAWRTSSKRSRTRCCIQHPNEPAVIMS